MKPQFADPVQPQILGIRLSRIEAATKLSDEWSVPWSGYQARAVPEMTSEAGFFKSLRPDARRRFRRAFTGVLVQQILSSADLQIAKFVQLSGREKAEDALITENVFRSKLIQPLLHVKPLEMLASDSEIARARERENILRALNYVSELAFDPQSGADALSELEVERRRRMVYQSSLSYVATLIRQLFRQVLALDEEGALIEKTPSETDWDEIRVGIRRMIDHPVWTTDINETQRVRAVRDALAKNQAATKAFGDVGLKLGYIVGADKLADDWNKP